MKHITKRLWIMVLCIGVSVPFASAGLIVFRDEPITLQMLEDEYDNTLPVGDKIFSNFEIIAQASGGALTPLKSDILVQGFVIDELNLSLQFILNGFSAAAGQSADIFSYLYGGSEPGLSGPLYQRRRHAA